MTKPKVAITRDLRSIGVAVERALVVLPVESLVTGSVWKHVVAPGTHVRSGDTLVIVESMKMEIAIEATRDGTVIAVLVSEGRPLVPGQRVATLRVDQPEP